MGLGRRVLLLWSVAQVHFAPLRVQRLADLLAQLSHTPSAGT